VYTYIHTYIHTHGMYISHDHTYTYTCLYFVQAAELHLLRVSEEALDMRKQWSSQVRMYVCKYVCKNTSRCPTSALNMHTYLHTFVFVYIHKIGFYTQTQHIVYRHSLEIDCITDSDFPFYLHTQTNTHNTQEGSDSLDIDCIAETDFALYPELQGDAAKDMVQVRAFYVNKAAFILERVCVCVCVRACFV
jgi:hypothetical protein